MFQIYHSLDIYNPGEFFASLGLLTVFSLQQSEAEMVSHFEISGDEGEDNATFVLDSSAELNMQKAIDDLANSQVQEDTEANVWRNAKVNPRLFSPVILSANGWRITLDWWLDALHWEPSLLKLWSGTSSPLEMMRAFSRLGMTFVNAGGTLFGFDTRASRDAGDIGYSKKDTREKAALHPLTELLSAIGLQRYKPRRFAYFAWQKPIPLPITHAAAIQEVPGTGQRLYTFTVRKIGQGAKQATRSEFARATN